MILPIHIIVALASLAFAAIIFFSPSKIKLYTTYALVAGTLISGSYLVIIHPFSLPKTCAEGLVYLAFVSLGIVSARQRLVRA